MKLLKHHALGDGSPRLVIISMLTLDSDDSSCACLCFRSRKALRTREAACAPRAMSTPQQSPIPSPAVMRRQAHSVLRSIPGSRHALMPPQSMISALALASMGSASFSSGRTYSLKHRGLASAHQGYPPRGYGYRARWPTHCRLV